MSPQDFFSPFNAETVALSEQAYDATWVTLMAHRAQTFCAMMDNYDFHVEVIDDEIVITHAAVQSDPAAIGLAGTIV